MLKRLLLCLLFCAPLAALATPKVLVLGDSLSAAYGLEQRSGWVALLGEQLKHKGYEYEVMNASISGETTRGGRMRIVRLLEVHNPAVVIIALGANDGLRGLPVQDMRDNLAYMIQQAQNHRATVLLAGMRLPPNYGAPYTKAFAAVYPQLAREYRVRLVPFLLDGLAQDLRWFQADTLHPTAEGEPIILDHVWRELAPMLRRAH